MIILAVVGMIVCGGLLWLTGIPKQILNSMYGNGQSE